VPESTTAERAVLFQCSDELAEFAALFDELAMPVQEITTGFPDPEALKGAQLAVVSGRRLAESGTPNLFGWPRTIAVIDDSSKTLVTHLRRIGVAMVIRRPVHPPALRLLLLHEIYRGPERRARRRVLIGHAIRVATGLLRPRAVLLELSSTGARIELAHAPKPGSCIKLLVGKDLTKGKPLKLQAKVVRCIRPSDRKGGTGAEIGVVLLEAQRHARTIKSILDRFALGPAKWPARTATEGRSRTASHRRAAPRHLPPVHRSASADTASSGGTPIGRVSVDAAREPMRDTPTQGEASPPPAAETSTGTARPTPPSTSPSTSRAPGKVSPARSRTEPAAAPASGGDDVSVVVPDAGGPADRRNDERIPYDERVVALDEEAARVLVGRDLSKGGMRIAATPLVQVGDILRVALHSGTQSEPLVVIAHALRDDGDEGIALGFESLSAPQQDRLADLLSGNLPLQATEAPSHDDSDDDGDDDPIVVAEMLERIGPETDEEIAAHLDSVFDTGESVENVR
jgi:hypothetical protein